MLGSITKLASGRVIATAIPFLAAPALGRLYTPADYTHLTLFLSINAVIAVFVTFQMQHGLLLEASDRSAVHLAWICLAIALAMSGLIALATGVVALSRGPENTWGWMFLLPVSALLGGLMRVTNHYATRRRAFGFIARVLVVQVTTAAAVSILLGYWIGGSLGLFLGFLAGQTVQALQQILYLRRPFAATGPPSKPRARAL
ncbi:MAG TPA: hypothetical protein DIU07_16940, partial [Rhodobacteraceae bacterium]|nr:hypothetical protein [Paracoccaceae bacterium]